MYLFRDMEGSVDIPPGKQNWFPAYCTKQLRLIGRKILELPLG